MELYKKILISIGCLILLCGLTVGGYYVYKFVSGKIYDANDIEKMYEQGRTDAEARRGELDAYFAELEAEIAKQGSVSLADLDEYISGVFDALDSSFADLDLSVEDAVFAKIETLLALRQSLTGMRDTYTTQSETLQSQLDTVNGHISDLIAIGDTTSELVGYLLLCDYLISQKEASDAFITLLDTNIANITLQLADLGYIESV
jgi:hypothetical protein